MPIGLHVHCCCQNSGSPQRKPHTETSTNVNTKEHLTHRRPWSKSLSLLVALPLGFLCQATSAQAQSTFDFTSGQGFVSGVLDGQPAGNDLRWNGPSSLRVNAAEGTLTWDVSLPYASFNCVSLSTPIADGAIDKNDVSISVDFELADLLPADDSAVPVFGIVMSSSEHPYDPNIKRLSLSVLVKNNRVIIGVTCAPIDSSVLQPEYQTVEGIEALTAGEVFRLSLSVFGGNQDTVVVKGALSDPETGRELASTREAVVPLDFWKSLKYPGLSFGKAEDFSGGWVVIRRFETSW